MGSSSQVHAFQERSNDLTREHNAVIRGFLFFIN